MVARWEVVVWFAAVDDDAGSVAGCTCGAGWQALGSTRDGNWGVSL